MSVVLAASMLSGAVLLAASGAALAGPCSGPGAPTRTQTRCLTAIQIPGNPLRSFDISWVNAARSEFYLSDRSNSGIDVIDTKNNVFKRTIGGFVGVKLNGAGGVNNNISGPDGVTSHGKWLYAGDGDSTLHVIDLDAPAQSATQQVVSTGGSTRVDEMALTADGTLLLAANNADDPPFGTLLAANGDTAVSAVHVITRIAVDPAIVPAGFGLSIEQPVWERETQRFYVSIPVIANNPAGCNYGQLAGAITCHGGLLVIDPTTLTTTSSTLVIDAETRHFANIGDITGSDEVWFNPGTWRYYTGSSRACGLAAGCPAPQGGAVLGVIDGQTSLLIETIPQSQNSHSVAADSSLNRIYVPQVAPVAVVGSGGDSTAVGAGICGSNNGCVAVYVSRGGD
jgi:hypothetical protein